MVNFLSQLLTNKKGRIMKTNRIMDEIRSTISPEMKLQMEMSVSIANRIYEILEAKGMTQKDLAKRLGKTETEVSRWLSGTHNLTLSTICKISAALGDPILQVVHQEESSPAYEFEPMMASEPLSDPKP
jgi:ribosome-binding protein aMBF1 (putative translation factor)